MSIADRPIRCLGCGGWGYTGREADLTKYECRACGGSLRDCNEGDTIFARGDHVEAILKDSAPPLKLGAKVYEQEFTGVWKRGSGFGAYYMVMDHKRRRGREMGGWFFGQRHSLKGKRVRITARLEVLDEDGLGRPWLEGIKEAVEEAETPVTTPTMKTAEGVVAKNVVIRKCYECGTIHWETVSSE